MTSAFAIFAKGVSTLNEEPRARLAISPNREKNSGVLSANGFPAKGPRATDGILLRTQNRDVLARSKRFLPGK
jgi:hypothetical protein